MTLAKKIEEILKDELRPENIKTVIDIAECLKLKEKQIIWDKIDEADTEYISKEEYLDIEETKLNGEFINQDTLLKELDIEEYEV
jgi:hypothetical protein